MRISSSLFFQTGVNTINSQQAGLMKLYQQIGTGKRMINPSDDPLAAAQTINIAQSQTMNLRYTENRQVAKSALSSEENTLTSVTSLLVGIKTRLVEAGNGTLSDADRAVLGNVLSNARDNLLGLANSTDGNGQYLFSGHKGTQPPFSAAADGRIEYDGDDGRRKIQVDQTRQLDSADTGREIFMQAAPGTRNYLTSAAATNTGTMVIGSPSISNAQGADIGKTFTVRFTKDAATDETTYAVSTDDGATFGTETLISQAMTQLDISGQVKVKISGVPEDGDVFTIEPSFSTDPLVSAPEHNVFDALDNLIAVLNTPSSLTPADAASFQNQLNATMQRVDVTYNQVLTVRSSVGTRLNEIQSIDDNASLRNLSYAQELIRLEELDWYEATAQLQQQTAALEAASLAFKQIQATSLFRISNG
ncbi:flagellar hook-associated protein FlgL [Neopusillimonas aromaticivorans]|uniref:flagellar hook-associated protein FlgL n=1 Tax=Neopusillimonas aromaticivorans TaxID=2979868 RepID=UPI002596B004|nr:flagellar hook-associated protein FlgL [Neopusillimonas aromaticivorans]WJJ93189.1 flagellar hook-associated protein FlgL [Neopusillimonas aromaticivorans]